jgi:hypothetical protein
MLNQTIDVVRYSREFDITVIVITEFDCMFKIIYMNLNLGGY